MDLSTTYLGLQLPHPLMPGASPLVDNLDMVRRLEDAGAAALVMHSLFEEQIVGEQLVTHYSMETYKESYAEALTYFPQLDTFALGPQEYLEKIRRIKEAVAVPVIASLNGVTLGGWLEYAELMEQAGADAIELNVYYVATDPDESSADVEQRVLDIARAVKESVRIPVAVKLSAYYSALAHFARQLDDIGVDGLVLFNRFYEPDIDIDELEVKRALQLSDSTVLMLRLHWLAILSGRIRASLAVTGGVQTARDAIKAIMAGADAVQMVAALLRNGPEYLRLVRSEMEAWMAEHEYESLQQMHGSMSLLRCPDPKSYERGNYVQVLQTWQV
jgi:dihydroorotate dehydrogenase (fumarate)